MNALFRADYALTAENNFTPISIAPSEALEARARRRRSSPASAPATGAPSASASASRASRPDISKVIFTKWSAGGPDTPARLGRNGAFVSKDYAKSHHLLVGSPIVLETPTGQDAEPRRARRSSSRRRAARRYGDVTISAQRFDAEYPNPQNVYTFVNMQGGVTAANTAKLDRALKSFPDAKIQTEAQFKKNQEQGITLLLNLLYVLLSLSIVVSLFGIVNTLILTVFERTRELGMLRAVGMTRRQVRRMIRHESIITALIGAALGIPVGVVLALHGRQGDQVPGVHDPVGHARRLRRRGDHRRPRSPRSSRRAAPAA